MTTITTEFPEGSGIEAPMPVELLSNPICPSPQSLQLQDGPSAGVLDDFSETSSIKPSLSTPTTSFRNVSACHRCRMRKHRCDQQLPKCRSCEKAQVRCVGYDPITKQEIPRSYVYFLESRVEYLNKVLSDHNIDFSPAVASTFDGCEAEANDENSAITTSTPSTKLGASAFKKAVGVRNVPPSPGLSNFPHSLDSVILDLLSGKDTKLEITRIHGADSTSDNPRSSIRSSFSPLSVETTIKGSLELPDRDMAERLVDEYFIHTNLHVPVLNRPDFEIILDRIYDNQDYNHPKNHLYFVFIVFAIGAASVSGSHESDMSSETRFGQSCGGSRKRKRAGIQFQDANEYHASAMACLENCFGPHGNSVVFGDYEGLQAVILLCSFALFRSTSPGLGSLLDTALRSAVDLRLYSEDDSLSDVMDLASKSIHKEGNSDWVKDLRRRLWWCVYSLDRLVAPYLERPLSIPDDVITTRFPSILDDRFITRNGVLASIDDRTGYKHAVQHRFRFRILQSEMHTVLQYRHALLKRGESLCDFRGTLPSSFGEFSSFGSWRQNMHRRLRKWKDSIPTLGPRSSDKLLMELDFWQSVITLYRWSVKIPLGLVHNAVAINTTIQQLSEETPDEVDWIFFQVAEASSNALHIHHMMQHIGCTTTPYLAAHEIFIAGSLLLFTVWNSQAVMRKLTLRSLDYSTLAATSALDRLKDKCRFAKRSMTTLKTMANRTMQMKLKASESETPSSCSARPLFPRGSFYPFPAEGQIVDSGQFDGLTFRQADPAADLSISSLCQIADAEVPVLSLKPGKVESPRSRRPGSFSKYSPASMRNPEGMIKTRSTNFKPCEESGVSESVGHTMSTPESIPSWNGSSIEHPKCISGASSWINAAEPLTPNTFTHSLGTDQTDTHVDEDFLDAYIVGWS